MRLHVAHARAALVVAPHPDDELIGAAGLIAYLIRRGTTVHVAVATDGAASHPHSRKWPRRRLIAARQMETRRALRRLGVMPASIHFLGLPDGGASVDDCRRALTRQIRRLPRLDLIVGPTRDDAHPDHQAVAIALDAIGKHVRLLGYRVWPPHPLRRGRLWTLPVNSAAKRSLIRLHHTQLGSIRDDPEGFQIMPRELDAFARPLERYVALR
ncbi:PIG-L family deacetylase [Sphingomonas sp. BT-65]|uniref:PIG-L deacetylase family protein n=1 Tax=Sphingomonas sp. BT-65 TaxID=2989821 RepID=UPI0022362A42|nr:PIG-L family deacetylase [Sphingomonas sp. BT-65]MCW4463484.1 PIG-L family deacetylase [Sphingomonas sp. BT-65]